MPIEITMPRLSDTMESGTIIKWGVSEGDAVSAGDVVADIETDKATMEMPVFDDGVLAKIIVEEGRTVDVGTVIAVLAEDGEDVSDAAAHTPEGGTSNGQAASTDDQADDDDQPDVIDKRSADQPAQSQSSDDGPQRISPVARRLIEEHGLDPRSIQGSGPSGRIIKRDVLNAVESKDETAASVPPSTRPTQPEREDADDSRSTAMVAANVSVGGGARPQSSGQTTEIELSNMRQTIAKRLVESKTSIPHYQLQATFNMDPLMEFRSQLNEQLEPQGVKLSVNDFLIRACALAIRQHPEFNSSWGGDRLFVHSDINVGVAIALPKERGGGLVVATVRNADLLSLRDVSSTVRELATKARERGLSPEDMADSTFTISNLGMYGIDAFNAIINPPNSAIIAVAGAVQKPVVRNGELTIGHEMVGTLSCDHRIIDGATGAQWLQTLRGLIENPATMLV